MNILLVGAGKMGGLICRELEQLPDIEHLYICDIAFEEDRIEGRKILFRDIENVRNSTIDVAFIASTANTHYEILRILISMGIRNIFVEKPAVMTISEYEGIMAIASDCHIVTGYILRHADSVRKTKNVIDQVLADGYHLESCDVCYEKYLPVTAEPRAMTDIGVFEETPHIWDLLFNYLGLAKADRWEPTTTVVRYEDAKPDRAVEAVLGYQFFFGCHTANLRINSSFLSAQRHRRFHFVYTNGESRREISLELDNENCCDILRVSDENGDSLHADSFPSLTKLRNEILTALSYFSSWSASISADVMPQEPAFDSVPLFETENVVLNLYAQAVGQKEL